MPGVKVEDAPKLIGGEEEEKEGAVEAVVEELSETTADFLACLATFFVVFLECLVLCFTAALGLCFAAKATLQLVKHSAPQAAIKNAVRSLERRAFPFISCQRVPAELTTYHCF